MAACNQCGDCCKKFCITLSEEDFSLWEAFDRDDILDVADRMTFSDGSSAGDGFWGRGEDWGEGPRPNGKACPWLMYQPHISAFVCRIHDVKPEICQNYVCAKT